MSAKKQKWTERFNQKNDFDFTVSRVIVTRVAYARVTKLIPITKFSLFGITVTEAMKIKTHVMPFSVILNLIPLSIHCL